MPRLCIFKICMRFQNMHTFSKYQYIFKIRIHFQNMRISKHDVSYTCIMKFFWNLLQISLIKKEKKKKHIHKFGPIRDLRVCIFRFLILVIYDLVLVFYFWKTRFLEMLQLCTCEKCILLKTYYKINRMILGHGFQNHSWF